MRKILFISIFLIGCAEADVQNSTKTYFDLAGFITQQITQLNNNQPLTHKSLLIEEKNETLNTTKIDWQKELELFLQADLNKQAYQLSYNEEKTPLMAIYTIKEGESLPIKTLKILFNEEKSPKHIEVFMQVKNYLYQSEKKLSMNLNGNQLESYHIEGWQELFIGSKKSFKIDGILVHKK